MENLQEFVPKSKKDHLAVDISRGLEDTGNLAFYLNCARKYPEPILLKAFTVALRVPAERIKKSRGALFNYLIHKYAHEYHENSSP